MVVVAARRQKQRERGSYALFHPEDHFRGFCLLNRRAVRGDGDRAAVFSFQKGEPFPHWLQGLNPVGIALLQTDLSTSYDSGASGQSSMHVGQVIYEHPCIYTCSFTEEGKLAWG